MSLVLVITMAVIAAYVFIQSFGRYMQADTSNIEVMAAIQEFELENGAAKVIPMKTRAAAAGR